MPIGIITIEMRIEMHHSALCGEVFKKYNECIISFLIHHQQQQQKLQSSEKFLSFVAHLLQYQKQDKII